MHKGIDVSVWQGIIDWEKAKNEIDFAMIRAGYGQSTVDTHFERNAKECERLGIPYGVYWFSYAHTPERAKSEAQKCLEVVRGYNLTLPVAFDFEYDSANYIKRQYGVTLTKQLASQMAAEFCNEIYHAGYTPMIYSNPDYLNNYFNSAVTTMYDVWLAQWPTNPDPYNPPMECAMWQYSNNGTVDGINTRVDMNIMYKDFMEEAKMIYHTREDIEENDSWALEAFDKACIRGAISGEGKTELYENDYNLSRDMLRMLVILDNLRLLE